MIISPDNYLFTEDGRYVWSESRVKEAWTESWQRLEHALASPRFKKLVLLIGIPASGKSTWLQRNQEPDAIYFDATFKGYAARARPIKEAKRAGKRVEAVWVDTPIAVCLERNECRKGGRRVPADIIVNMAVRLTQEPPTTAEGFDKVTRITYRDPRTAALRIASRWHVADTEKQTRPVLDLVTPGGISERKRPEEFDRDELAKGMTVEMEEIKDPHQAMQVAMRHLTEKPNYYLQPVEK